MFETYRANQLAEVPAIGMLMLKVKGANGAESKWLAITPTELEKIIAALEPEDYARTMHTLGLQTS